MHHCACPEHALNTRSTVHFLPVLLVVHCLLPHPVYQDGHWVRASLDHLPRPAFEKRKEKNRKKASNFRIEQCKSVVCIMPVIARTVNRISESFTSSTKEPVVQAWTVCRAKRSAVTGTVEIEFVLYDHAGVRFEMVSQDSWSLITGAFKSTVKPAFYDHPMVQFEAVLTLKSRRSLKAGTAACTCIDAWHEFLP